MKIKKGPRTNFWFLFILIFIVGLICLLFIPHYLAPYPYYSESIKEFGIALIIASILGSTTESFIHEITEERINKIEDSTTHALLRELVGDTVYNIINDHIISKPFKTDKFRLTFKLKKEENDKVDFTVISSAEITNIGNVDSKHKLQLYSRVEHEKYSKDPLDNNTLTICKMEKKATGDFMPIYYENINLKDEMVETIKDEEMTEKSSFDKYNENIILKYDPENHFLDFSYYYLLRPGEKIKIEKKQNDMAKNDDFFYLPIRETVINGPLEIKIEHNPEELKCDLRLTHPNLAEKELKPSADGNYDINDGLIPGFSILLSWSPINR